MGTLHDDLMAVQEGRTHAVGKVLVGSLVHHQRPAAMMPEEPALIHLLGRMDCPMWERERKWERHVGRLEPMGLPAPWPSGPCPAVELPW